MTSIRPRCVKASRQPKRAFLIEERIEDTSGEIRAGGCRVTAVLMIEAQRRLFGQCILPSYSNGGNQRVKLFADAHVSVCQPLQIVGMFPAGPCEKKHCFRTSLP